MSREIAENSIFWKDTSEHHLLSIEQLDRCLSDIPDEKRTADKIDNRLARLAIHHGFLTLWQAQRVLTRRTASLFIEKYLLVDTLGQGGMGRVFLAKDRRLNRLVAIKVLNPDRTNHERSLARFEREAQVGGQLQHENLVRIYDVGVYNQSPYLVMEYIEGPTVAELIAIHGKLDVAQTARIGRDVALGLQHLAEKKMVHRDVNPRNILIDMEGRAKLTDLGLAIFEEQEAQVTNEGSTVGTFDYISPEQARHSHGVDIKSDIYSLGCSLYHMLCGQVPFPAGSLPEKIYAHQVREPMALRSLVPGLSREMVKIVNLCMKKTPDDRFESARALADRLSPLVSGDALTGSAELTKSMTFEIPSSTEPITKGASGTSNDPKEPWGLAGKEASWHGEGSDKNSPIGASKDPDAIQIDLGADSLELPYRTDGLRRKSENRNSDDWNPLSFLGLGQLLALIAVMAGIVWLAGFALRPNQFKPTQETVSNPNTISKNTPEPVLSKGITIVYPGGQEETLVDLTEAVRRISGKKAEIRVDDIETPWVWVVDDNTPIVGTRLQIRGTGSDPARIILDMSNSKKGLQIRADSSLDFSNLLIEAKGQAPDVPLVISFGELNLQKCKLIQRDSISKAKTAFRINSRSIRIRDTWIHGFEPAIDAQMLHDTVIDLEDCLLTEPAGTHPPAGKKASGVGPQAALIHLNLSKLNLDRARIGFNHVSLVGTNLISVRGDIANQVLSMDAAGCLFKGASLLSFAGDSKSKALPVRWTGDRNLFDISFAFSRNTFRNETLTSLEQWSQLVTEKDSQSHKVPLSNPASHAPSPSDFEPRQKADREFGVR